MGVAFATAKGTARPLEDVLLDLSDAFAALPEGGARTAAAMSLLGRSGTELVPTLIQGQKALAEQMAQMKAYGAVVTEASAESSGKWQDSMDEMGIAWYGLKMTLGQAFQPALQPHLDRLLEWTRTHQPEIKTAIEHTVDAIVHGFESAAPAFQFLIHHWRQIGAIAGGVAAYMAGPAVLGVITTLGPALLTLLSPMGALRLAILGIQTAINPVAGLTRAFSIALALLTAYVIATPGAMKGMETAMHYVAAAGKYVYDVFEKAVAPAIGRAMTSAFARLQPYLPTTASLMEMVGRAADGLGHAFGVVVNFLTGTVIPAFGNGLAAAFEWIGPKLHFVSDAFGVVLDGMSGVANWIVGPGVDAVQNVFAGAWQYLGIAIDAVQPYVVGIYDAMAAVVSWIVGTAAPAIGGFFADAWRTVTPVMFAFFNLLQAEYESILAPFVGWLVGTAVPAMGEVMQQFFRIAMPVWAGISRVLLGVWDIGRGLFSWLTPALNVMAAEVRFLGNTVGWVWTSVFQPVIGWIWSVAKPVGEFFNNMLGYLLEKVGKLLSWVGNLINISGDAAKAVP